MHIPGFPFEYYIVPILWRISNKLNRLVKIDLDTTHFEKINSAQICVEINFKGSIVAKFRFRRRSYKTEYEGIHLVCFDCVAFTVINKRTVH